jgi:ATP-dependent 26S proteasome regulatory subunit
MSHVCTPWFAWQIEFPNPDRRQKRLIFQACTAKMNLGEEVDLEVRLPSRVCSVAFVCLCVMFASVLGLREPSGEGERS